MRSLDEKVIRTLTDPISGESARNGVTEAEACAFFYRKLHDNSMKRRTFIKECIGKQNDIVRNLESKAEADTGNKALTNLCSVGSKKVCSDGVYQ